MPDPNQKEIHALLHLVDDPDGEVFEVVAGRLLDYGKEIIPQLERLQERIEDSSVQLRIESLINRALFKELFIDFSGWAKKKDAVLLEGALIIAKHCYADFDQKLLFSEIQQIQKNIWLELNHYLSPLEEVNVINSILYSYYKMKGEENVNKLPDCFSLNYLLEQKKGNSFSIGILYLIICEGLDIPVFAVDLPRQFILGYFDSLYHFRSPHSHPIQSIQFYIDPVNGMVYTQNDVKVYLNKIKASSSEGYNRPLNNKEIIFKMLEELAITYNLHSEPDKKQQIKQLQELLRNHIQK